MNELDSRYDVGRYLERSNRFVMTVERSDGSRVEAYCPNTSRLIGLLEGHPRVLLTRNEDPSRKTNHTIHAFRDNEVWVGIKAANANEIFDRYLRLADSSPFDQWETWDREVPFQSSQIDFVRVSGDKKEWVEVKSLSSRASDGRAFYSGTPSERGYRHLDHLGDLAEDGDKSRCVFVVQRSDVSALAPAEVTESDWLEALREASGRGVDIRAYRCEFDGERWEIAVEIPTIL
jgi:sugar fermentation stimulation protein A